MACPYFFPIARAEGVPQPARAPLGEIFTGRCEAGGSGESEACNFGYARSACEAFPQDAGFDAVRYSKHGDRIIYVLERDYFPAKHGDAIHLTGALARQAEVFLQWTQK